MEAQWLGSQVQNHISAFLKIQQAVFHQQVSGLAEGFGEKDKFETSCSVSFRFHNHEKILSNSW